MLEHLLKMLGFKAEHIDDVIVQIKLMTAAVTQAVKSGGEQQRDIAFIAACYRARLMREAKANPEDNDLLLIDAYYPVHNPLPSDGGFNQPDPAQDANTETAKTEAVELATNDNPNIGRS